MYFGLVVGFTASHIIILEAAFRVIFFIGIAGVVTYLTIVSKRSEVTLKHQAGFQENIIANARVWLTVLNERGEILLWNTAAEDISGYSSSEVMGKNDIWKMLYPQKEYRKEITDIITRIITDKKYFEDFETTIRSKQGDYRVISWNTKSIPDETGKLLTFVAIGIDVTDRQKIEQMLFESEERFRLVFENLPIGLWVADKAGTLLMGNPAGQKIWEAHPLVGQDAYGVFKAWRLPSREWIQPDDWALGYAVNEGRITENELLEIEAFDGTHKIILNWSAPVKNKQGDIVGAFVINQDITQSKQDEELLIQRNEKLYALMENLKASEEKLASQLEEIQSVHLSLVESEGRWSDLFNRNKSAIAIYRAVDEGKDFVFTDFNPAGEEIEHINRDEVIGKRVTTIFPGIKDFGLLSVFQRVYQTGIPEYFDASLYKDERIEGWRDNLVYRLSSGEIVAIYADVTDRKFAEESLQETNSYLENLISIANVPIIIWDPQFQITRVNHAFELLIGRPAQEVVGKSIEFVFPPYQADRSIQLLKSTQKGVQWETTEIDLLHKDGSVRNVIWNSATLYTPDGSSPVATIVQGRDITDLKRIEYERNKAVLQIQKNLAQLAILNDGIRNPLTIIIAYAEMMSDSASIDQIMIQIRRIDEMVNQLDRRWAESEAVLNVLRKHYQIVAVPSSGQDNQDETGNSL